MMMISLIQASLPQSVLWANLSHKKKLPSKECVSCYSNIKSLWSRQPRETRVASLKFPATFKVSNNKKELACRLAAKRILPNHFINKVLPIQKLFTCHLKACYLLISKKKVVELVRKKPKLFQNSKGYYGKLWFKIFKSNIKAKRLKQKFHDTQHATSFQHFIWSDYY